MVVPITLFSQPIMEFIFTHIEDSRYGSLLASTALFFIPTVILGMLSPYSVRLLVTDLGTIITSFYFVLAFDVNTIISAFALTLGSLGLVAIVINTLANNKGLAHA